MAPSNDVHLVMIGGHPCSGKTHIAYEVCRKTGFIYLDKDSMSHMVEQLLIALKSPFGPNERDSELYSTMVRPLEYECLRGSIIENISLGNSTVVSAPMTVEFSNPHWRVNFKHDVEAALGREVQIHYVWVHASEEAMRRRMIARRASRDKYKLANWDYFLGQLIKLRPMQPCFELDCSSDNAGEYRAMEIIGRFGLVGPEGYVDKQGSDD